MEQAPLRFSSDLNAQITHLLMPQSLSEPKNISINSDKGIQTLRKRADDQIKVRREIHDVLKQNESVDPNLREAYSIFEEVAPFIDQIFIGQLEYFQTTNRQFVSWKESTPDAVNNLSRLYDRLRQEHADFFERNSETREIFDLIVNQVSGEKEPEKLKQLAIDVESKAVEAAQKHKPVFLFCLSSPNLDPDKPANAPYGVVEANLRFISPLSIKEQEYWSLFSDESWIRMTEINKQLDMKIPEHKPSHVFGNVLSVAGSELWTCTTAERFTDGGFMLNFNLIEPEFASETEFQSANKPENLSALLIQLDILHELGHEFTLADPALLELGADLNALMTAIRMYSDSSSSIHILGNVNDFFSVACSWYASDSVRQTNGISYNDAYIYSARTVLPVLLQTGILKIDGRNIEISNLTPDTLSTIFSRYGEIYRELMKGNGDMIKIVLKNPVPESLKTPII